jgi:DNA repair exonuclease SbcCD ATPase subunit
MVLRDIEIEAAGPYGWFAKQLTFGQQITQLYGPNGCGKTPIIQSIAFALGYPVKFREDVYQNCEAVILRLAVGDHEVELRRAIAREVDIRAVVDGEETKTFYNERELSGFIFSLFEIKTSKLTSTRNEPVDPYISTFLPLFFVDQDVGYSDLYKAPTSFIKSQHAEMMRLAFGLSPKHSFDKKKFAIQKAAHLGDLDRRIVRQQQLVENLTNELPSPRRDNAEVEREINDVREQIESMKNSRNFKDDAGSAIDRLISTRQRAYYGVEEEIRDLRLRVDSFGRIKNEIEVEINTLSLNDEARRLFSSFEEICSNSQCGLFLVSAGSYGKNLLYLRDQIKDLERNTTLQESRIDLLNSQREDIRTELSDLEKSRSDIYINEEIDAIIEVISELTTRIIDLQKEKQTLDALKKEECAYIEMLTQRESIQNELASLAGGGTTTDLDLLKIRRKLRDHIVNWLDILHTKNVSRDVYVDSDFGIQFGKENIRQIKGSTLTRVILAVRAAVFELYTENEAARFRFLILDTPRQQDIESADLGNYVSALKSLSMKNNSQIIFSTTEYRYQCTDDDKEWIPEFSGLEQNMFLGTAKNR